MLCVYIQGCKKVDLGRCGDLVVREVWCVFEGMEAY